MIQASLGMPFLCLAREGSVGSFDYMSRSLSCETISWVWVELRT